MLHFLRLNRIHSLYSIQYEIWGCEIYIKFYTMSQLFWTCGCMYVMVLWTFLEIFCKFVKTVIQHNHLKVNLFAFFIQQHSRFQLYTFRCLQKQFSFI